METTGTNYLNRPKENLENLNIKTEIEIKQEIFDENLYDEETNDIKKWDKHADNKEEVVPPSSGQPSFIKEEVESYDEEETQDGMEEQIFSERVNFSFHSCVEDYTSSCHRSIHSQAKKFKCPKCKYETNHKGHLNVHLLGHSREKKFKCSQCSYGANRNSDLQRHLLYHSDQTKFNCRHCNYGTNREINLKRHLLDHSGIKQLKCSQCNYKTNRNDNLKTHVLNHTGMKLFKCSHCLYGTNRKDDLRKHLLSHTATKEFKCSQCSYETTRKDVLEKHLNNHLNGTAIVCKFKTKVKKKSKQK